MPEKSNDKGFAMTSSFSSMTLTSLLIFNMEELEGNKEQITELIYLAKDILENQSYLFSIIKMI